MVTPEGTVDANELYDVAAACGFTVHQVRLCVARLTQEGLFTREGRGRNAVLRTTPKGVRRLEPEADFMRLAWGQDAGLAPWDGTWHLVGFSIDEERRAARNALREHLVEVLAGAPVYGGLYVSALPWDDLVVEAAEEFGVADRLLLTHASYLSLDGVDEAREVARRLWSLDELAEAWKRFLREYRPVVRLLARQVERRTAQPIEGLAALVRLTSTFNDTILQDPILPPELLPPDWPGTDARALLLDSTRLLSGLRREAGLPSLFRRFDAVMTELLGKTLSTPAALARPRQR